MNRWVVVNRWLPAVVLLLSACGAPQHRFPLRRPMWVDEDRRPFGPRPEELETLAQWDRIDHTLFRPLSDLWRFERGRESIDVNAMDEVPSSSWFTMNLWFASSCRFSTRYFVSMVSLPFSM